MAAPVSPKVPEAVAAAFQRFMAAYPRRRPNPTAPARLKFAELVKAGVDPEQLIAAAGRFAALCAAEKIAPPFVPQARRWLHQREFEDFLTLDAPATADPAQPSPDRPSAGHPLAWLGEHMTTAAFASWIAPLRSETGADGETVLIARTVFARDRVDQDFGHLIRRRLGRVRWRIDRS